MTIKHPSERDFNQSHPSRPPSKDPRVAAVENDARRLELSDKDFRDAADALLTEAERFLASRPDAVAFSPVAPDPIAGADFDEEPGDLVPLVESTFAVLAGGGGVTTTSGRFFGYVPGGGLSTAALAEAIAALTNRYAGIYAAAPGAVAVENACIRWLQRVVGFPRGAWGSLQSGGTTATVTSLVTARDRLGAHRDRAVLYVTAQAHMCCHKALHIIGMGNCIRREIPTDAAFRMDADALDAAIATDVAAGNVPWLIFASAGTTNTGSVDPLPRLADLAAARGIWLHVDGAYGGLFALTRRGSEILQGIERADSLVVDPHKALFLPYGLGACLVRDGNLLKQSFGDQADYLADVHDERARSPADYGQELTRHFRGLRLWFSLRAHGVRRFRSALEEKLALATQLAERLASVEGLELSGPPQLTVVAFRHRQGDAPTRRLLQAVLQRGVVHISSTKLSGSLWLRACVLCFRSHQEDVDLLLSELRRALAQSTTERA